MYNVHSKWHHQNHLQNEVKYILTLTKRTTLQRIRITVLLQQWFPPPATTAPPPPSPTTIKNVHLLKFSFFVWDILEVNLISYKCK